MKRSLNDSNSSDSSTPPPTKSSKRLKLENEIFSTSIQDIEKMFSEEITTTTTTVTTTTTTTTDTSVSPELLFPPNKQLAPPVRITRNTTSYNSPDSCQYLDNIIPSTSFNYDCINMSFLEPSPSGNFIPIIRPNHTITNMYLDIDNDDYDDYDYKYDYKPLINEDLLMIDQLILKSSI